jgi:hypothetical protein
VVERRIESLVAVLTSFRLAAIGRVSGDPAGQREK